ncbi:hypothetical protein M9458_018013, partial [Cirrhinus mrigala]
WDDSDLAIVYVLDRKLYFAQHTISPGRRGVFSALDLTDQLRAASTHLYLQ